MDKDTIILGSGDLYVMPFTGTIPEDSVIETEANKLGYVKNGGSVEYTSEFYTASDDAGLVDKTKLTKEDVIVKSGIITPAQMFDKICSTARKTTKGSRTSYKIGGMKNQKNTKYVVRWVYHDEEDGDLRATIVGNNQTGFSLAFAADAETVVDVEFKALANDKEGTLLIFDMDEPETTATQAETTATK